MKKQIDISGYVYSGKSSVSDILREVDGLIVPDSAEEFDLLRIPNGLIDLKNSVIDWSPIRTHAALLRFEKTALYVGTQWKFPLKYIRTGLNYQQRYPSYFSELEKFMTRITLQEWQTPWQYDNFNDSPIETFKRKVGEKLGIMKLRKFRLINADVFLREANNFTLGLLWSLHQGRTENTLITHNALEPFNPARNSDLLGHCKCIVVDRDPRDIYATAQVIPPGQADRYNRYRNMCGAHDVDTFIARYKNYRARIVNDPQVLRLNFSDIVENYEQTLTRIFSFLEIDPKNHTQKKKHFKPEVSVKTLNMWKQDRFAVYQNDFLKIQKSLNL